MHNPQSNRGELPSTPQPVAPRRVFALERWCGRVLAAAMLFLGLAGCNALGPRQLPIDRFDYNSAIARSANEQMLLNVVRLRFNEVPVFLAVNSVLTQYVWNGEVGVAGASGDSNGFPAWTVGGSGTFRYIERPTITYSPLNGQEFAGQLISPVRADVVFSLVSSGWPPDQLLSMSIQRINAVENIGFADPVGASRDAHTEFRRVVDLIIGLSKRDAIELVKSSTPGREETYLEFSKSPDEQSAALIRELKGVLGLDANQHRFRVTRKIVGCGTDEITIRMHSLLELMGLLSAGVDSPSDALVAADDAHEPGLSALDVPMRVLCTEKRPVDAFVEVQFRGRWFSIPNDDHTSKRAFGLLNYLFQMQSSQNQGAGPLLTVPVG